jgi:hypothetical protein
MQLMMSESKFGVPVGSYTATFVGAEPREPLQGTGYGPALEWTFKVENGLYAGKVIGRLTAAEPTVKNSCGRLLQQLTGGAVGVGSVVDLAAYVGRRYTVLVEPTRSGEGTRIGAVVPAQSPATATPAINGALAAPTAPPSPQPAAQVAAQQPAPSPPAQQPATEAAPPPPQSPTPQAAAPQARRFWHIPCIGEKPVLGTEADVAAWIAANNIDPAKTQLALYGTQKWQPAASFGFTRKEPF